MPDLTHINAALTRTGSEPITSFVDGTTEAIVAGQNYEAIVTQELSSYRWKWATKQVPLVMLQDEPELPWGYAYQLPAEDFVMLRSVEALGISIPFERMGQTVLANYDEDAGLVAKYTYRPDESVWPGYFRALIIKRLEALFLRAIGERYREAADADQEADRLASRARLLDSQSQPARDLYTSSILRARRA